jgi:hypothetical protein
VALINPDTGARLTTVRLTHGAAGYHLTYSTRTATSCVAPNGAVVAKGAERSVTIRLAARDAQAAGSAVVHLDLSGTRHIKVVPNTLGRRKACIAREFDEVASGYPTRTIAAKPPASPRGTGSGASVGSGTPRASRSGWTPAAYWTALAYENSLDQTYVVDVPSYIAHIADVWGCTPGATPPECAAAREEGGYYVRPAVASINRHLTFMRRHPAAACFRDAYQADRAVARTYLAWLDAWGPWGGDQTSAGRDRTKLSPPRTPRRMPSSTT